MNKTNDDSNFRFEIYSPRHVSNNKEYKGRGLCTNHELFTDKVHILCFDIVHYFMMGTSSIFIFTLNIIKPLFITFSRIEEEKIK